MHKDPDTAYGVAFPDVPGCFSGADKLDDIAGNARQALALWFEDAPEVDPRSLEDIREQVAPQLVDCAFLMLVPFTTRKRKPVLNDHLPEHDVAIEVKRFLSPRANDQLQRHDNVFLIQGLKAAEAFAAMIAPSHV
ncbi:type II toxin-antitoxin system HicB family antitoxin [Croceicoccus sp. YJ47]|uniref:type II toxin-antitoxin system HicB family antitoxin n=1 Tax=Croceicoccus sp. YJ47 TaxID=2798724 RepID=UPI0019232547|nr:type II toxin-antitoxin system HicB family antitoxin [Croceicoccus sp. YJ47]QQN73892.1 type II toxin-antitoxin system HicB family antitoxin [Croceicoccus sp. YJ47]